MNKTKSRCKAKDFVEKDTPGIDVASDEEEDAADGKHGDKIYEKRNCAIFRKRERKS